MVGILYYIIGYVAFKSLQYSILHSIICFRYIINFLLDSTIGLFIVYIGIRICQYLAKIKRWDSINFGEYGKDLNSNNPMKKSI